MPRCDAAYCAKGAGEVLRSPGNALLLEKNHHELQVLCLDVKPAKRSRYVFLEHAERDAVGQESNVVEKAVEVVILESFVGSCGRVYKRLRQVVDLPVSHHPLTLFLLDMFDHKSA